MFSSKAGTLDAFRTWLRNYKGHTIYNGFAAKLDKAYGENTSGAAAAGYGPNFENAWRAVSYTHLAPGRAVPCRGGAAADIL